MVVEERVNFKAIELKWQKKWADSKLFEAEPDKSKKKFFVTLPYPYVSGFPHLGHSYTYSKGDVFARYKRMQGYNVLFPFSFHCTGTPIVAAAQRVKEGEPTQISILKQIGISDEEIKKFADPVYWTEFFPVKTKEHLIRAGFSVDWRRSFITTDLNPHYSRLIDWQYLKLKEKGYVVKGSHPVVWCPKCKNPAGDHARKEGEGITPEPMAVVLFKSDDGKIFPCATLRPETTFGVTNLWINPDLEYVEAKVNGETWILSEEAVSKFEMQKFKVEKLGVVKGSKFIAVSVRNPVTGTKVPVLPGTFVKSNFGTGVVMSVPAHAPYDYIALRDLKRTPQKYNLSSVMLKSLNPISLISIEGFGENPAVEIVEKSGIKDQHDKEKLENATHEIYRKEFHKGILKENTGKYKGLKVSKCKDILLKDFVKNKWVVVFYELNDKVVCRCLTDCVVNIVENQWFLNYGNAKWKKVVHKAVDKIKLYPDSTRKQFHYVVDWLKDWACTREFGLGTPLPWDRKWMIEALSDSTIYMSFYTIYHIIKDRKIGPEQLIPAVFDYVFLGTGNVSVVSKESGIAVDTLDKMKDEFNYWYPFDFRNTGKDLIQNHMTFCLFNHVAIFPEKHWPAGFGLNGHVKMDGDKMSKSKGNFVTLIDAVEKMGADASRLTVLAGGEGVDDSNFDSDLVRSVPYKLENMLEVYPKLYGKGRDNIISIDKWFVQKIDERVRLSTSMMEDACFGSAIQTVMFDMTKDLKWYLYRSGDSANKDIVSRFIEVQVKMLSVFVPHFAEEVWEKLGMSGFVSVAKWPSAGRGKIDKDIDLMEDLIRQSVEDVRNIKSLVGIDKPKIISVFISPEWKYKALTKAMKYKDRSHEIVKILMADKDISVNGKQALNYAIALSKKVSQMNVGLSSISEYKAMIDAKEFLEKEFGCTVEVVKVDKDIKSQRALKAEPSKPGIEIE